MALQLAAAHEVETLVGAAEFDIGFEGDGIVSLHEGVEHFVEAYGLLGLEAALNMIVSGSTVMSDKLAGTPLFGTFLNMGSPVSAEVCGQAGFDWVLVDLVPHIATGGLGWYTGAFYNADRVRIASLAQEALFRTTPVS